MFDVVRFREKPNLETAEQFLAAGNFLWNSGIFVWRADTILRLIEEHQPELFAVLGRIRDSIGTPDFAVTLEREFPQMPSISIDYAVLEKSQDVCVLEAPFTWDDVGSWSALARLHPHDEHGNTVLGKHRGIKTTDCTIYSSGDHVVTTIGLEGCVIVHTETATMVAKLDDEAQVKELLAELEDGGFESLL